MELYLYGRFVHPAIKKQSFSFNESNTFEISKILDFGKLLILRYQFIGITISKSHLVCTFYDKQISGKKYEWKFGLYRYFW